MSARGHTSATRATVTCSLSAAVASVIPITVMFATLGGASLGGASCGAGPTRCRRRRPPSSSSSSSSSALTRPDSGCLAVACPAAIPSKPQPAAAAEQVMGRCWQALALYKDFFSPRLRFLFSFLFYFPSHA